MKNLSLFLFIILACFWGGSFVAIKIVVTQIPPIFGAACRLGLALVILTVIYKLFRKPLTVPKSHMKKIWLTGIFMQGLPFSLLFWGEQYISPGLAGILNGTVPLWTFILSLFILRHDEKFSAQKFVGILIGFLGIFIIFSPKIKVGVHEQMFIGSLAVLMMAISYGIGGVLNRLTLSGSQKINRYGSLYQQHISSFLFLLIFSFISEGFSDVSPLFQSWTLGAALFYLSFFSNALAWMIYFYLIETWGAIRTSSVTYAAPVMALSTDFIFFKNIPQLSEGVGALFIFLGILLLQYTFTFRKKQILMPPSV